jgi:tetratricopeptide (TPR) repeat protein
LSATPARADDAKAAQAAVKAGMRANDLGKYDEAMAKLEEAYRLQGDPHLLFNMGQVYWKQGKDEDARRMYESYLRNLPDAGNRGLVEERLAELERRKKERTEKETPAPPLPPAAAEPTPGR